MGPLAVPIRSDYNPIEQLRAFLIHSDAFQKVRRVSRGVAVNTEEERIIHKDKGDIGDGSGEEIAHLGPCHGN